MERQVFMNCIVSALRGDSANKVPYLMRPYPQCNQVGYESYLKLIRNRLIAQDTPRVPSGELIACNKGALLGQNKSYHWELQQLFECRV